jgi:hypothetical protein
MSVLKRHIPTRELLGEYLTLSPTPQQVALFEADMRTLNPTLLRDSIREAKATKDLANTSLGEQRNIIHRIYTRKVKEFSSLYPVVFAVENALRSALADHLGDHFGRMDWWVVVRDAALAGQDHKAFQHMCGRPVARDFLRQSFFIMNKLIGNSQAADIRGADRTDHMYYHLTMGDLTNLIDGGWSTCRPMFRDDATLGFRLDRTSFATTSTLIRDARNALYHSNPIRNRPTVFAACERVLNALDFHLGDYDADLKDTTYTRVAPLVARAARHCLPAR